MPTKKPTPTQKSQPGLSVLVCVLTIILALMVFGKNIILYTIFLAGDQETQHLIEQELYRKPIWQEALE